MYLFYRKMGIPHEILTYINVCIWEVAMSSSLLLAFLFDPLEQWFFKLCYISYPFIKHDY